MLAKTFMEYYLYWRSCAVRSFVASANLALKFTSFRLVNKNRLVDYYLHKYENYAQYKGIQVVHNRKKIEDVWSDRTTLSIICGELTKQFPHRIVRGICHGTRNGFEQQFMSDYAGFEVIGTEISDTYDMFENTVQWDFHDLNEKWISKFVFVYSNSLDQAWSPRAALVTWLNQLNNTGILVIEHTELHGPEAVSEMDPFGVRPTVMPYILSEWFGWNISLKILKPKKDNNGLGAWIFLIKKKAYAGARLRRFA